jgi:hypothetical protein
MDRPFRIQRVQNDASEFAAFKLENEQFKDRHKGNIFDLPQDHIFKAGSLTLRVVAHETAACSECAFMEADLYCEVCWCGDSMRKDETAVIFIADEDLLKLRMRGEL